MSFNDYLDNLKQESERGAIPNDEIPIERFIQVADNIMSKIDQSMPKQSMLSMRLLFFKIVSRF